MAEFLEFNLAQAQSDWIANVFGLFINERGEQFSSLIISNVKSQEGHALFLLKKYSLEEYKSNCEQFEQAKINTEHRIKREMRTLTHHSSGTANGIP
jgi:hypothetical protein